MKKLTRRSFHAHAEGFSSLTIKGEDQTQRLNKYLANSGICSRRDVASFLKKHYVTVNGQRVKKPGVRIDLQKDDIRLHGNKIKTSQFVYYLVNKPTGIISTTDDEYRRENVTSLVPFSGKIYPVGRLDKDTTGLLLLTNDGELTYLLTHPKYHIDKVYRLQIANTPTIAQLHALRNGVLLQDGLTASAKVVVLRSEKARHFLEMTIHEGRNRQIRRMCETVGIRLLALQRIRFGTLSMRGLAEGKYRTLTDQEVDSLKKAAGFPILRSVPVQKEKAEQRERE